MRLLVKREVVSSALGAGLAVSVLCVPFLCTMTPPGTLRTLRIAVLCPLAILLFQVGLAWTPLAEGRSMVRRDLPPLSYVHLALFGLVLACVESLIVDPLIVRTIPSYFPNSRVELLFGLPFMALFQPLVFVVGCYAFTARLTKHPIPAMAAVVLGHQGLLLLKLHDGVPVHLSATLLLVSGTNALILGASYRQYGYAGPAVITLISQSRHLLRFI